MTTVLQSTKSKFDLASDPTAAAEYEEWLDTMGFQVAEDLEVPADQVAAYQQGEKTQWVPEVELWAEISAILVAAEVSCLTQLAGE